MRKIFLLLPVLILLASIVPAFAGTITVTVTVEKKIYYIDEMVFITVCVYEDGNPVSGATVGVEVRDPHNNTYYVNSATTGSDGCAIFWFKIAEGSVAGIYNVYASTDYGGGATVEEPEIFIVNPTPVGGEALPLDKVSLLLNIVSTYGNIIILAIIITLLLLILTRKSKE